MAVKMWFAHTCQRFAQVTPVRILLQWVRGLTHRRWSATASIDIELSALAPLWLRFNDDFRPLVNGQIRMGTGAEMSMDVALAPEAETAPVGPSSTANGESLVAAEPSSSDVGGQDLTSTSPLVKLPSSLFVRDFLVPYQATLQSQKVMAPLLKIIAMLEEHGECPSVVLEQKTMDEECADLYSIRDTLGQVTLKDHTHRVTRHGLSLLQTAYKDYEPLIPKMLVACLGHDLGKIPAFRASNLYSMRDHPAISIVKVKEAFEGHDPFWLDEACQIIGAHHRHVRDGLASLLKQADGKAREEEVAYVTGAMEIKRWEEWFDVEAFVALVEPLVNMGDGAQSKKREWVGISLGGVVYCQTTSLYGLVRELARNKKVVDIHLLRASDRDDVLRKLATSLGAASLLADPVGEGYFGRKYTFRLQSQKQFSSYCLPIIESAFRTTPSVLEARKQGFLKFVMGVEK